MEAMRKLVATGMKLMVKIEKSNRALAKLQRSTDRNLDRLIGFSTKRRSNGHRPNLGWRP